MPNVTFYQLETTQQELINHSICELLHGFYAQNRKVYVLCPDVEYYHQLDEYILNYLRDNFFPYQLYAEGPIPPAPICLGLASETNLKYDILINLHPNIPADFKRYREIIEFVPVTEDLRILAREHYKHYNKFNCITKFSKINHHANIT